MTPPVTTSALSRLSPIVGLIRLYTLDFPILMAGACQSPDNFSAERVYVCSSVVIVKALTDVAFSLDALYLYNASCNLLTEEADQMFSCKNIENE